MESWWGPLLWVISYTSHTVAFLHVLSLWTMLKKSTIMVFIEAFRGNRMNQSLYSKYTRSHMWVECGEQIDKTDFTTSETLILIVESLKQLSMETILWTWCRQRCFVKKHQNFMISHMHDILKYANMMVKGCTTCLYVPHQKYLVIEGAKYLFTTLSEETAQPTFLTWPGVMVNNLESPPRRYGPDFHPRATQFIWDSRVSVFPQLKANQNLCFCFCFNSQSVDS